LGCAQKVDQDGTVIFDIDAHQRSNKRNIWIAGEATGIGGADLALIEGEIAGLSAAGHSISRKLLRKRSAKRRFAKALQRSYPIGEGWTSWIKPSTTICRCEEVSAAEILGSVSELGAQDARGAKLFTRAGMGLCQGRVCARNVSELISSKTQCPVSDLERIASSNRPLAAPISLGMLADGKRMN
jgi:NAD(P)H-nitrite reductase large subunit